MAKATTGKVRTTKKKAAKKTVAAPIEEADEEAFGVGTEVEPETEAVGSH